jgi:hypothetical protein
MTVRGPVWRAAQGVADRTAEAAALMFLGCVGHFSVSKDKMWAGDTVPASLHPGSCREDRRIRAGFEHTADSTCLTSNIDIIDQILI